MKNIIFKNIKNISISFFCMLAVCSCESYFDTKPYDFIAPETFYNTEDECKMALAGVYYTLTYEKVYGNYYSCMISNIDDLSYYQRNAGATAGKIFGNDHSPSEQNIWGTWETLYKGINNANMLIENIDKAEIDDKVKTRIKGEAKFLRAYFHFLLAQAWYDIPLRKSSFKDVNNSSIGATPHVEAIDWIISEMEECVNMVDDHDYDKSPSYVKKTNVMGILARVYLWRAGYPCNGGTEFYKKAAFWANEVKKTNKHKLNPDIYVIWKNMAADKYDTEYNESMWEAEFVGNRVGNNWTDGRIGNVIGNVQKGSNDLGYGYGFYAGTLILWDLFDEKDIRRDLSMAPYWINAKDEIIKWRNKDEIDNKGNVKKAEIVQRCCGKYRREWETSVKDKNWTPYNYPILRYADVLLMLAEAENEANQGPTQLAYECINEIRKRANIDELSGLDYETFKQEVRDERGRELCFESLRKYDLVRWGIYVDAIQNKLGESTKDPRWSTRDQDSGASVYASRTTEKHQFLPIPTKELDVNIQLKQNKYWSSSEN